MLNEIYKKRKWLGIVLISAVLLFQLSTGIVIADTNGPSISIDSCDLQPGATASLAIKALNMPSPGLAGYVISVFYDPQVIDVLRVDPDIGFAAPMVNSTESGRIGLLAAQAKGVPGNITLSHLIIKAKSSATVKSSITISISDMADSGLQKIIAVPVNGLVNINGLQPEQSPQTSQQGTSGNSLPGANKPSNSNSSLQNVRAGTDRYETAKKIALAHYNSSGPKSVFIANGYAPADALAGAPLAYKMKAPIILATKEAAGADALKSYLNTTKTTGGKLTLLGSTGVLDNSYNGVSPSLGIPQRLGGANRRETAISIAKELIENKKNVPVVVVNENDFVDAISIAPIASVKGWPILLTNGEELSSETAAFLDEEKPDSILVIGGESVVSNSVFEALSSKAPSNSVTRLGGKDRFETNALVLQALASNSTKVAFANGDSNDVIDALAGAALGIPIVLVHEKDQLNAAQQTYLHQIGQVPSEIFGGPGVIATKLTWD